MTLHQQLFIFVLGYGGEKGAIHVEIVTHQLPRESLLPKHEK